MDHQRREHDDFDDKDASSSSPMMEELKLNAILRLVDRAYLSVDVRARRVPETSSSNSSTR